MENSIANILVATVEETQEIITNYGEDDGMVVEMTFVDVVGGGAYYESVSNVSDIAAAFMAGKNVVLHFPEQVEMTCAESYVKMIGYSLEANDPYGSWSTPETVYLAFDGNGSYIGNYIKTQEAEIVNGKLKVPIYID